MDLPVVCDVIV